MDQSQSLFLSALSSKLGGENKETPSSPSKSQNKSPSGSPNPRNLSPTQNELNPFKDIFKGMFQMEKSEEGTDILKVEDLLGMVNANNKGSHKQKGPDLSAVSQKLSFLEEMTPEISELLEKSKLKTPEFLRKLKNMAYKWAKMPEKIVKNDTGITSGLISKLLCQVEILEIQIPIRKNPKLAFD